MGVCPKSQVDMLRAVKAKHEGVVNRVYTLPEALPKIDFAAYKARLPQPAMADRFEKAYSALEIPYPTDKENVEKDKEVVAFKSECSAKIAEAGEFLKALDSLPAYYEMTDEMYYYYFPEVYPDPDKPRLAPYRDEDQPNGSKDSITYNYLVNKYK